MSPIATPAAPMRLNKVPEVTLAFWIIKMMSTTVGETGADVLAVHLGLGQGFTRGLAVVLLAATLVAQLRTDRCVPWLYWLCVVLVSIVGTEVTDALTDGLGVSLSVSTTVFAIALAATFRTWYRLEHTLAITRIDTRRRELFYWGAILLTFALGTAAGDLATEAAGLGFRLGIAVFGAATFAVIFAYRWGADGLLCFWLAYILTRPLGASLGDYLSRAASDGGLGLGSEMTSVAFLAAIVVLVARLSVEARQAAVESRFASARRR